MVVETVSAADSGMEETGRHDELVELLDTAGIGLLLTVFERRSLGH